MSKPLSPGRLEAFSDGVIAVIITIMVLELHVPGKEVSNLNGLIALAPLLLVYLLSFVQTGIYWVNHHYLVDDLDHVTHGILWSNLAFLFTLSLFPFATRWLGERAEAVEVRDFASGDVELEHHDGDDDGNDSVGEGFEAAWG